MAKITLGTWAWGAGAFGGDSVFGSDTNVENLKPIFDAAMSVGLNLWDTATVYGMGDSEKILGSFVATGRREDVLVSTKFTPQLAEMHDNSVEKMALASMERMGLDYIDVYWIHNPMDVERWTPGLIPLLQSGKVKRVGVSNHNISEIRRADEILGEAGFKFCAALPLPDVAAAIAEVEYAYDTLGADGVKLATNSYGQYLGDPALDTLMQVLNDRHAVVILHPHRPEPVNREVTHQTPLAMQDYLAETTRAIANMITRNIPARFPDIKFVVPHCGAYLPLAIPRMNSLYPVMKTKGLVGEIDWEKCLAPFYYDLAGAHSPETKGIIIKNGKKVLVK